MKSFSDLTSKEKTVELLRWIGVAPAAVIAGMAPGVIARLVIPPVLAEPLGSPPTPAPAFSRSILFWVIGILMGAAFVIAGAKTAPRYRGTTAIVLASLSILYSLMSHVVVHLGRGTPHYTDFAVAAIAAACAAAYIVYSEKSKGVPQQSH